MKKFISQAGYYPRIFQENPNTLIKFSSVVPEAWKLLQTKKISFINTPQKIEYLTEEEKLNFPNCNSKIELPYLKNYISLDEEKITKNFNTEKILKHSKSNLSLLKKLHDENISHADIHSKNIMIDKDLNIIFIDLDAMIIESYVSEENVYFEDTISIEEKQEKSKINDKVDMLNIYLWYLKYGTFKDQFGEMPDIYNLMLPQEIQREIESYQLSFQEPSDNYYFEDIIEELLKQGYEAPKLLSRK